MLVVAIKLDWLAGCGCGCRVQAEEQLEEEGGFPEGPDIVGGGGGGRGGMDGSGGGSPEEGGNGLREVCIDMATIIKQVRLLASAMQVSQRCHPAMLEREVHCCRVWSMGDRGSVA